MRLVVVVSLALSAAACGTTDEPTTFADVAPVLDTHCMQCHQVGGIAPQSFEDFAATEPWADRIAAVTAERSMPPKQVTADGTCGDFVDDWWLSDEEIATLAAWADGGAPEGEPVERSAPEQLPSIEPTHTLTTPTFAPEALGTPEAINDEYRCFPIEVGNEGGVFLTGFDTKPGNPDVVHHVIGHFVDPDARGWNTSKTNATLMAELDAASPDRLGWPCFSGAGHSDANEYVSYQNDALVWAPGQGAVQFPEGTGVAVPERSILVAQVHYNLSDPATVGSTDTTTLEITLEPEVERPTYVVYLETMIDDLSRPGRDPVSLPPGEESVEHSFSVRIEDIVGQRLNLNVIGVVPHMHERGVTLTNTIERNSGGDECLVEVPDWDFNWQYIYFFEEPVRVYADDVWTLTCTYDTSDATEPVKGGWGTQNEMCLTVVYATL